MASDKACLEFVLNVISEPDKVSYRSMMGEYIIYYGTKVVGGIYDNRFLIKPTKSAVEMMPDAKMELPYEGAGAMLRISDTEEGDFLRKLLKAVHDDLPEPKAKKKKVIRK